MATPDINSLIERSSFGTPEAKALRASVSEDAAKAVVARARELERSVVEVRVDPDHPIRIVPVTDAPTYTIPWPLWKALCDARQAVDDAEMEIAQYVADHYPAADEVREWVREYDV